MDFVLTVSGEASITQQMETTVDGIARTSFAVSSPGTLEIQAESEPAKSTSLLARFQLGFPECQVRKLQKMF